ncbi:MAG: type II secretion system F family protein [Gemmataceae bacterium]
MNEIALYALFFTVTAALAFLGLSALTVFQRDADETAIEPAPRVFGPLTPVIAGFLPVSADARLAIQKDLLRAGFFEPVALVNFLALRSVATYFPLLTCFIFAAVVPVPLATVFFISGIVLGLLGFAVPRLMLGSMANQRSEQIRRGLPMLMDTLGLTLSTGASLPAGLARSGEAIQRGNPELSREVRVVVAHGRMRSLGHALDRWKDRQPLPELGSFVYLLGQSDRLGTDITRGLWELSSSLQVNGRQRAEAAANRANFYMIFPTVLCLLTAAGLILAGPGIVRLIDAKRDTDEILRKAREQEDLIKQEPQVQPPRQAAPSEPAPPLNAPTN